MWRVLGLTLIVIFGLTACDGMSRAPARPFAEVGTRALIKSNGREFIAEVVAVEKKLVTVDFHWAEERRTRTPINSYDYYRGLFPVSGTIDGKRFELDYVEADIEPFFPLKKGKSVGFEASMQFIDSGQSRTMLSKLTVVGKKTFTLESGPEDVFVVEIENRLFDGDREQNVQQQVVYYAPKLSMVLKNVRKERGREFFWRVISVDRPSSGDPRPRRRRGGTVAI